MCFTAPAQVNSGSTGSDGALDFSASPITTNMVIDMHDHPTGIYNYTYVNIPNNVTVSFIPNANNSPVTWLVQSNVVIRDELIFRDRTNRLQRGASVAQVGYRGGTGGLHQHPDRGLGGGLSQYGSGGNASFGSAGSTVWGSIQPGAYLWK